MFKKQADSIIMRMRAPSQAHPVESSHPTMLGIPSQNGTLDLFMTLGGVPSIHLSKLHSKQ